MYRIWKMEIKVEIPGTRTYFNREIKHNFIEKSRINLSGIQTNILI